MIYITVRQAPKYHQMSLEEFLFSADIKPRTVSADTTTTRTYKVYEVPQRLLDSTDIAGLICRLHVFNNTYSGLREVPRQSLYDSFKIPKKSGGLRPIDAPNQRLMGALRDLKSILEQCGPLYHTSAYAYVKHRSTLKCMQKHQQNESRWYAKFDLHNFFGSTTPEFVYKQFSMVFPFSEVMKDRAGRAELEQALELAFLNGGLPQGTPISPFITNVMMIPIDHELANEFRSFDHQRYVYTRYADDFQVSSKYSFRFMDVQQRIVNTLDEFDAPFYLNAKKTRYGSIAGANWNLGLMTNQNNEITVGSQKKRQLRAMLCNYVMDRQKGVQWPLEDIQTMEGYRNYYKMVEPDAIGKLIGTIDHKYNCDVCEMMKKDLAAGAA